MALTIEKRVHLSDAHARHLERLAAAKGTTEDALIAKALTMLFDLSDSEDGDAERKQWSMLSLDAFARVWDNEADAVYDNWKELYGVSEG